MRIYSGSAQEKGDELEEGSALEEAAVDCLRR